MNSLNISPKKLICGLVVILSLYLTSLYSYLLFHSLVELFSIAIAYGIFIIAWHTRRFLDNNYLLFLGVAYFFIGSIDLLHTLAYKGMGVFPKYGGNLPTQLWIAARYMESLSLVAGLAFLKRRLDPGRLFGIYALISILLLLSIFYLKIFPDCFLDGLGLTPFKKISEYVISIILAISAGLLFKYKTEFDTDVYNVLLTALFLTIGAELAFTFYISVYGFSNLIGHYFKLISFYLVYKAVIETGLEKPYSLLFRNLKASETELRKQRNSLQDALKEIKILKGILPICSHCKKIRDDTGYWNQIESYISKHSGADFSHGICPECADKLYAEYNLNDDSQ